MKDKDFMRLSFEKARKGAEKGAGGPFGAVIEKDGKVVSAEHNTVLKDNDPTAHAEVNAIRAACKKLGTWKLSGCTIYSSTEPCPMCFAAIHWARISRLFYSTTIEDAYKGGFSEMAIHNEELQKLAKTKVEIIPHFLQEEGKKIFEWWNKKEEKHLY